MKDIFISYSREDRIFVEKLQETLIQFGVTIWIDVKNVPPTAKFVQEMYRGIEEAGNFLFIVSPKSVISEMCNLEVSHALLNNKRIIPLLYRNVKIKELLPGSVKTLLETVNWLSLAGMDTENVDFIRLSKQLINIVETDLDYIRQHTRFLERAKEWEAHEYNQSYLLQGDDLKNAEDWLEETSQKQPPPTELHHRYIHSSKTHQLEESNRWEELYRTSYDNRRKAEKTLAEFYKEQGRSELLNGSSRKAALYLSEAYRMSLADSAIRFLLAEAMETIDAQLQIFKGHDDLVMTAEFSPDGLQAVTASWDKTARVWDIGRRRGSYFARS